MAVQLPVLMRLLKKLKIELIIDNPLFTLKCIK
jgi:hypothetical protein